MSYSTGLAFSLQGFTRNSYLKADSNRHPQRFILKTELQSFGELTEM